MKNIINSIIIKSNKTSVYQINIEIKPVDYFGNENIIGSADWETGTILLNESNESNYMFLNDEYISRTTIVLLHEVLHVLGLVGLTNEGRVFINTNLNVYTGTNGVREYKNILELNNIDTSNLLDYIPIEDDFGTGTATNHFEEGIDNNYNTEYRYINNIYYPVITNEISTGFVDSSNYLTSLTVGLLEDLGFTVNYNSNYIKNIGNSFSILREPNTNANLNLSSEDISGLTYSLVTLHPANLRCSFCGGGVHL